MPNTYGACWGDAVGTANSMIDGTVRFDDLDTGVYAVYETVVPDAIDRLNNNYWIFEVDATKGTVSDPVSMSSSDAQPLVDMKKNDDGAWTLLNRRKTLSLNIQKNWSDGGIKDLRPEKLTFDLYRNGELYLTKEVDAKNGGYLGVVFPNLSLYDDFGKRYEYKVAERAPEGYTSSGAQTAGKYSSTASQTLYFTNTRLGVLDVKKVVKGSATTAAFGFAVTLTDSAGKALELADGETIAARRFTTDSSLYTEEALTPDANGNVKFTLSGGETPAHDRPASGNEMEGCRGKRQLHDHSHAHFRFRLIGLQRELFRDVHQHGQAGRACAERAQGGHGQCARGPGQGVYVQAGVRDAERAPDRTAQRHA